MSTFRTPITIDSLVTRGVAVCQISHVDLTDADTSQVLTLSDLVGGLREKTVPANSRIVFSWFNVLIAFSGGGNSAVVAKLGDAGSDNELITNVSVFTGGTGLKPQTGSYSGKFEAAYAPIVTFTTTDGTCAGLTAGLMEVCIEYETIGTESVTS
jgi:hypothetical protein